MKIGDRVKLLGKEFNDDAIGKVYEVDERLPSGLFVLSCESTGPSQFYDTDWGKDCYEVIPSASTPETSARHNEGKVQLREIDPAFITGLGEVLTASRAKYDEGNWMKETKFSTPYESAMRHLMKFWDGQELDDETTKHHLLHAATNLMFLYYHTRSGKGIDDRLFKKEKK